MRLDLTKDFYLTHPNSTELDECLSYVIEVSDGLLHEIFKNLDVKQVLTLVSGDNSPLFSCESIFVIKSTKNDKIVAMLAGSVITDLSLPSILKNFIADEKIRILRKVLCENHLNSYYINTLYVAPEYRGLGFATLLLDLAQAYVQKKDLCSIVLHCYQDNKKALKMYKNYGFEIVDIVNYKFLQGFKHSKGYICKFTPD